MPRRSAEDSKGLFFIPPNAEYFCICHLKFWVSQSKFKKHMRESSSKREAGAKAVQCAQCYRWFSNNAMLDAHRQRVNNHHSFPDSTDFITVGVPDGEDGLQMVSRRVLCLNTVDSDLDELEPQNARLQM